MTRVFVDTRALVALLDRADLRHADAREAFGGFAESELVSHGYVVAETLAVARRRLGVDATVALIDDLLPAIDILPVLAADHAAALENYRASLPSGTSFVDQVSFGLIQREGITRAFVLDGDFTATGVEMLPSPR